MIRAPSNRLRTRTFERKGDTQKFLNRVEVKKDDQEWIDPELGKVSFGEYLDGWLATKVDVARSTKLNIDGRVAKHIRPFFGAMKLNVVRANHARAFVAGLASSGLAPLSVKSIALTASQVFAQAVDDGLIGRSPFAKVSMP